MSNYVPGEGPQPCDIMFIDEAPGENEDRERRPFVGKAGVEFDKHYLRLSGLRRSNVYVTNVYKYRPPNNRVPTDAEIESGKAELADEISACNPRIIVPFGGTSLNTITTKYRSIDSWHGIPFYPYADLRDTVIMPCLHPAGGLHNTSRITLIRDDFIALGKLIRGEMTVPTITATDTASYRRLHNATAVQEVMDHAMSVAVDTETGSDGRTWSVQFAIDPGHAYIVLAEDTSAIAALKDCLETPGVTTIFHNAKYDLNALSDLGIHPSAIDDTMVMAYLLGNEPQGLKDLVLRHLHRERDDYKTVVKPSRDAAVLAWIQEAVEMEWPDPDPVIKIKKRKLAMECKQNIAKKLKRVLKEHAAGKVPSLYDRVSAMKDIDQVTDILGEIPIGSLDSIPFEDAMSYACADAVDTLRIMDVLWPRVVEMDLLEAYTTDIAMLPMVAAMERNGMKVSRESLKAFSAELTERSNAKYTDIIKAMRGEGFLGDDDWFNPNSSAEVMRYLNSLRLHPKSTEAKYIEPLADKHPTIKLILEYKRLLKLKSTYADSLQRQADADSRVHPNLTTTFTDTGRLSSRRPNLQNQPYRTEDGKRIRSSFVPADGCVLMSIDYSQIEMRIAAHVSGDSNMLQVFIDDKDIHTFTAARAYHKDEVSVLPDERYRMKRTGFGVLYGISAPGLLELFKGEGIDQYTEQDCDIFISEWFGVFPGVRTMMNAFEHEATATGMIHDMFGRMRLVPEVYSAHFWLRKAGVRQAGNFPIQSAAQIIIKKAMGKLEAIYPDFNTGHNICRPLMQIHDELLWECSHELVDTTAPLFRSVMESVVTLRVPIKCDVEVGTNWRDLEKWKPKTGGIQ